MWSTISTLWLIIVPPSKNCGYYWCSAAWMAYYINHPLYTTPRKWEQLWFSYPEVSVLLPQSIFFSVLHWQCTGSSRWKQDSTSSWWAWDLSQLFCLIKPDNPWRDRSPKIYISQIFYSSLGQRARCWHFQIHLTLLEYHRGKEFHSMPIYW